MKKICIIVLSVLLIFMLIIKLNKKNDKTDKITVAEVTHSIFYAPFYVAIEKGYFKDEGLDIKLVLTSGADKVSASVLSGDAQIGLAGAESAIYVYNGGEKDYLQIFSGLTKRDGQFILGRNKVDNFDISMLKGKEILVGRKGGMPSINFLNALQNSNISEKDLDINYQIDFASLSGAFIGKTGDYVNLFEPNASLLEKNKEGYILASVGKLSGEMPYTTFYARKNFIKNNKETIKKFNNAINKGLSFVEENEPKVIAEAIHKQFPDNTINELTSMIKNYKQADSWLNNTVVSKKLFENLEDLLIKNKLIESYVPFNKLVINLNE